MPHLLAADLAATNSPGLRQLACDAFEYLLSRRDIPTAYDLAIDLRQQWRDRLGDNDEHTLEIARYLGWALQAMGRWAEARRWIEKALALGFKDHASLRSDADFEPLRSKSKAKLDKHLSEVRLVTDGQSIFKISRKRDEILDALRHGQMAFFVAIDDIARGVSDNVAQFRADRDRFVRALEDAQREVHAESVRMAAAGRGRPLAPPGAGGGRSTLGRPTPGLFHPPTR